MNLNNKIIINNIITFIILLLSFYVLNDYLSHINFEMQYQNYLNKPSEICITEGGCEINETEELRLGIPILILVSATLISILNTLWYLNKQLHNRMSLKQNDTHTRGQN